MQDTTVTVIGNVVADPELRLLDTGVAMTRFRVASTQRRLDRTTGEWRDVGRTYLAVTCWRRLAEHVQGALRKGDPVVVVGRLAGREWEREGQRRYGYEVEASTVAVDLTRTAIQVLRQRPGAAGADGADAGPVTGVPVAVDVPDPMTASLATPAA